MWCSVFADLLGAVVKCSMAIIRAMLSSRNFSEIKAPETICEDSALFMPLEGRDDERRRGDGERRKIG